MTKESLTYKFNESLTKLQPPVATISHDTVERWLKTVFPRHSISQVQSDYCDSCAEMKQQINGARRSLRNTLDNGSAAADDILAKERTISSYEASLRHYRSLAVAEQAEY
eukprot:IDg21849t1